ncbi:hypothetical protein PR202_ga31604 [Eleusine coracana subsp. coracana]|uniref:Uncharacterized protein n=1 Tax=Eleusine coracana subsp. coracana TaxID=191504 RepID=A0AAV5DSB4_ELECO|nr:hypothetical protein PR202_ga31604 [Eleusine coracana subsp. coracana]
MSGTARDGARPANAADEEDGDRWIHGEDFEEDYEEEEEEDGYEFGDAEEAMQCVEMAERSAAARAHDYEALAARKRKALAEEQPQREDGSKRPRQDDLSEAEAATMFDQLMEGFGLRRKRRSKEA